MGGCSWPRCNGMATSGVGSCKSGGSGSRLLGGARLERRSCLVRHRQLGNWSSLGDPGDVIIEDAAWLRKKHDAAHINVAELDSVIQGLTGA